MEASTMTREYEILQNKINLKISNSQHDVEAGVRKIEELGDSLTDFITPIGTNSLVNFSSNGSVKMEVDGHDMSYGMHRHAIAQTADKYGIPTGYAKKLASNGSQWERDLVSHTFNRYNENTNSRRVLVREVNGEVRGVLSDKYRRLNTPTIYSSFFSGLQSTGAVITEAWMDDTRSAVDTIYPTVMPVETPNNGIVNMVFGMRISNSDFGDGALIVQAYSINVVCLNGMTRSNIMRQIHLGTKIPDNMVMSENTYKLDTQTSASAINDIVQNIYSKDNFEAQMASIVQASTQKVDLEREIKKLPKAGVHKGELEKLNTVLIGNSSEDGVAGEATKWKLSNALTAVARDSEGRRKRELEDIAGSFLKTVK